MAKLHFKYGAMNSGKSDTIIKTAYNYLEQGLNIATVKPSIDTKSAASIVARGGAERVVDILAAPDTDLRQAVSLFMAEKDLRKLNCVLVDESQFLSREQVNQLFETAKIDNISGHCLRPPRRLPIRPLSR